MVGGSLMDRTSLIDSLTWAPSIGSVNCSLEAIVVVSVFLQLEELLKLHFVQLGEGTIVDMTTSQAIQQRCRA